MGNGYFSIKEKGRVKVKIQRSAFLGFSFPSAINYCWAYRKLPSHEYFSDGGDPPNFSRRPALEASREYYLWNPMIFVVRYFRGIKLKTKELISAYHLISKSAVELGDIIKLFFPIEKGTIQKVFLQILKIVY